MSTTVHVTPGGLVIRPATLEDAAFSADVFTANDPDEPTDPVLQRYQWENPPADHVMEPFVAEHGDAPAGFAVQAHAVWEKMPQAARGSSRPSRARPTSSAFGS